MNKHGPLVYFLWAIDVISVFAVFAALFFGIVAIVKDDVTGYLLSLFVAAVFTFYARARRLKGFRFAFTIGLLLVSPELFLPHGYGISFAIILVCIFAVLALIFHKKINGYFLRHFDF